MLKREEERKRFDAERMQQQKIDYRKQQLREDYVRRSGAQESKAREFAEESRRLELLDAKKKRVDPSEELRKRKKWAEAKKSQYAVASSAPPDIYTPFIRKRKPSQQPVQRKAEEMPFLSLRAAQVPKHSEKAKQKAPIKIPEKPALSLSVSEGLPVSLSVGQKQVQVLLIGKNSSVSPMPSGIEASITDSQNAPVQYKPDPRSGTIDPEGESKFKIIFDLPEDVARGRLTFSAVLKENAIYVDRQPAKSNSVSLSSQVKSSMDLQYVKASARLEDGALALEFKNVGESGGILETSSWLEFADDKGNPSRASLTQRTKVKGGQKGILLLFSPAQMAPSSFTIDLAGKDSNGKAYSLKKKISEKEETTSS